MDRIAFMMGESFYYWTPIILTLATAAAVCLFWGFYLCRSGNAFGAAFAVPVCIVLGIVFSRFAHWYCRADSYESFQTAMTDYSSGGYALMGVFAACILTACVLRLVRIVRDLPEMLDCMCIAGSAGIAAGRLACFFSASDRGQIVASMTELPWVYPVTNTVSGAVEYRLATFVIQSMTAGAIFVLLALICILGGKKLRSGSITALFLVLYGACQVVLDSTRYDSLYLRSNGFVSMVQILGAVAIVAGAVVFSVWMAKRRGWHFWYLPIWIAMLAAMGGAGYMEYHVQRHGDQAVFAYTIMSECLGVFAVLTVLLWILSATGKRNRRVTIYPTEAELAE